MKNVTGAPTAPRAGERAITMAVFVAMLSIFFLFLKDIEQNMTNSLENCCHYNKYSNKNE